MVLVVVGFDYEEEENELNKMKFVEEDDVMKKDMEMMNKEMKMMNKEMKKTNKEMKKMNKLGLVFFFARKCLSS